nr:MAG TPA: hypothetical protein [Caudoviricetes sp.]
MKKTVWFEFMNADSKAAAIEVIKRMGGILTPNI